MTKAKLLDIASTIIFALKTAKRLSTNPEPDWKECEEDWYNYLLQELIDHKQESKK